MLKEAFLATVDVQTREEFWVSGVKRNGSNRHWAGSGPVQIDDDVKAEYEALVAGDAVLRDA